MVTTLQKHKSIIRLINELHDQGMSLAQIAAELNSRGITGNRGGKFHASSVQAILAANTPDSEL